MLPYMPSISDGDGSMLYFLASRIFTFSSISSLTTWSRGGVLCVDSASSFARCSISKLVIGSPLTMSTTVWARAGVAMLTDSPRVAVNRAIAAARRAVRVMEIGIMMTIRGLSVGASCPLPWGIFVSRPWQTGRYCRAAVPTLWLNDVEPIVRRPICSMMR
jgi:hypothetical protein